jgi:hypothetical protein
LGGPTARRLQSDIGNVNHETSHSMSILSILRKLARKIGANQLAAVSRFFKPVGRVRFADIDQHAGCRRHWRSFKASPRNVSVARSWFTAASSQDRRAVHEFESASRPRPRSRFTDRSRALTETDSQDRQNAAPVERGTVRIGRKSKGNSRLRRNPPGVQVLYPLDRRATNANLAPPQLNLPPSLGGLSRIERGTETAGFRQWQQKHFGP